MRRAGLALLASSLLALVLIDVLGPAAMFLSWGLALAGLLLLRRDEDARAAAHWGLGALGGAVAVGIALAGLTIGARGRVVAATPAIDPTLVVASIGFAAAFVAAAAFSAAHEARRGQRLALAGAALALLGGAVLAWNALQGTRPSGGSLWSIVLTLGTLLTVASLARISWRAWRAPQAT